MASKSQDLTQGSIGAHLTRMTIPMFLGVSSMIVASMVDTIYIGIIGAAELAAYSFTFPLIMGLSGVSMGVGTGAASLIARAQGEGDKIRVRRFATHSLLLTMVFVLTLMGLALIFLEDIFSLIGAQPDILPLVIEYMSIWIVGLPLFSMPMVASTVLRSVGNAKLPGLVMILTSVVQVVLAPLLIFGLLGFLELGFVGSAWASIVSGLIRTIAMFAILIFSERLLQFGKGMLKGFVASTRSVLYIGFPSILNSLIGPVSMAIVIRLLSSHGPEVVAGFGITSRFEMLVMMVLMSLSSSVGPFVGQNWGARKIDRVYKGLNAAYKFCLIWGVVSFVVLAPFGDNLVALVNDDPRLVESAGWYLLLVPFSFGLLGIGMMSGALFVALGRPVPTTVLALFRMIVVYLPLAILFDHYWGYIGVFVATTLANLIVGCVAFFWSRRILVREIRKLNKVKRVPGLQA
jgi:putative MATE family efflux protein